MNKLKTTIALVLLFSLNTGIYAQLDVKWEKLIITQPPSWFATREAYDIAENVLLYQRNIGGWPKNIQMQNPLSEEEKQKLIALKPETKELTTDNKATTQ